MIPGAHILIKNCVKSGKRFVTKKLNIRTITLIYGGGIYSKIIDENYANFIKDEEIIVNYNQIALIDNNEWTILKNDVNNRIKNVLINDEYKKNNPKNNKRKSKRKK